MTMLSMLPKEQRITETIKAKKPHLKMKWLRKVKLKLGAY